MKRTGEALQSFWSTRKVQGKHGQTDELSDTEAALKAFERQPTQQRKT
jgi:hypothetical protein